MKKILPILLVLVMVATMVPLGVFAEEENTEYLIPCLVTGDYVRERKGPGTGYKVVCKHRKNEVVDVADTTGTWWQLANGNYMHSKYLSPMCENDMPGADVDFLVVDDDDDLDADFDYVVVDEGTTIAIAGVPAELGLTMPRMTTFVYAPTGTSKDALKQNLHSFVLLSVSEQCIECYQYDEMSVRIKLTTSPFNISFHVTSVADGGEYDLHSVKEIMDTIYNYSYEGTFFVILP